MASVDKKFTNENGRYLVTKVKEVIGSPLRYKGNVEKVVDLDNITDVSVGDVYTITESKTTTVYSSNSEWIQIGSISTDMSDFYTKNEADDKFFKKVGETDLNMVSADSKAYATVNTAYSEIGTHYGDILNGVGACIFSMGSKAEVCTGSFDERIDMIADTDIDGNKYAHIEFSEHDPDKEGREYKTRTTIDKNGIVYDNWDGTTKKMLWEDEIDTKINNKLTKYPTVSQLMGNVVNAGTNITNVTSYQYRIGYMVFTSISFKIPNDKTISSGATICTFNSNAKYPPKSSIVGGDFLPAAYATNNWDTSSSTAKDWLFMARTSGTALLYYNMNSSSLVGGTFNLTMQWPIGTIVSGY